MTKMVLAYYVVFAAFALVAMVNAVNDRPIIGIVSEKIYNHHGSYIAASYVKYLESAGARVVPILGNSSMDEVKRLFGYINGVLFPGGGASLNSSMYSEVGQLMFSLAKNAFDEGDYFPLWGTCLGFQLLCVLQAGNASILTSFDAENYSIPLNFTESSDQSRLFSVYSNDQLDWLSNEPIAMNNHHYGVTPELFAATPALSNFYLVLSTNVDRQGKAFVSSMEAKNYPFYGVQWHPEKNSFEWLATEATSHTGHAVEITQATANFFVNEARKSNHRFLDQDEEGKALIYNYCPVYTDDSFEQKYYF